MWNEWETGNVPDGEAWTGSGSGLRQMAGTCECGNDPSGPVKCGEFLD